jgi:uncharacterized protein involved in exopolysaccharide biosynthesis
LETQLRATPPRLETQRKTADNPQLQEKLKTTLLNLTLKRTELVGKFDLSYPPIRDLDAQITQTQALIEAENRRPVGENSTDQNPTYQWLTAELAKARSELPMLRGNLEATERSRQECRDKALALDAQGFLKEDLARTVKAEENNYLLYQQKREEARIADALDNRRISNVVLAEAPVIPLLPSRSRAVMLVVGTMLAAMFSMGCVFATDYFDSSFRKPLEVEQYLDLPVLAAIPLTPFATAIDLSGGIEP